MRYSEQQDCVFLRIQTFESSDQQRAESVSETAATLVKLFGFLDVEFNRTITWPASREIPEHVYRR